MAREHQTEFPCHTCCSNIWIKCLQTFPSPHHPQGYTEADQEV